ncbi:hypothetical protein SAMN05421874_128120 [Nonomuraea maritima]|uniref:Uncharacterized protein n=1 Tax=Nonomuraea maritima TaxID=683260 RepID=A0A1G9MNS0_9ACTN|nr:hypothetical protein [Nonomuraea maritima]SDL75926.1 hypothetical protein SAMN05421874_128120 [Nonomuraea maritima]
MNPQTLMARANLGHWTVARDGQALVLERDGWTIRVLFDGTAPVKAVVRVPGSAGWRHLNRRDITTHVRGRRDQMTEFRVGDPVKVGDRVGQVVDMYVETPTALTSRACPVRLVVSYVEGEERANPYVTSAQHLRRAVA